MSERDVQTDRDLEVVRRAFDDWEYPADLHEYVERHYASGVEFQVAFQGGARDDPRSQLLHGRRELAAFLTDFLEPYDGARWEVDDMIELGGGDVLALLRVFLRMPDSEAEVSPQPFAYVITVRDGLIARVQDYPDRAEAFSALGL
jgi:ketosteroid isomerase-like protein